MAGKLAAASAVMALLSTASAIDLDPNAKTVAFDIHRRTTTEKAPLSGLAKRKLAKRSGSVSEDLSWGNLLYYMNITLGTPGQPSAVWVDTGSSDLWLPDTGSDICDSQVGCAGNGGFNPAKSSTYKTISKGQFDISYASGDEITGDYGQDKLTLDNANIDQMIFGVANKGSSQEPISGIMGVGYKLGEAIAAQTEGQQTYPNIVDNLVSAGLINSRTYSLWLNDLDNGHGTILFGGVDTDKYSGDLGIVDVQQDSETGFYDTFTVVLSKLTFTAGGKDNTLDVGGSGLPVILDSGTTLTYLPTDLATAVYQGLGVAYDDMDGAYVPCNADTSNMFFTFTFGGDGGVPIQVNLGQFVLPFEQDLQLPTINGEESCMFGILPTSTVAQGGGDILFGDTFLRSAYIVYDLDNNQIGLAQTKFDVSDSSVQSIGQASQSSNTIPGGKTVANQPTLQATQTSFAEPTLGVGGAPTTDSNPVLTSVAATFQGLSGGLPTGTTTAGSPASTSSKSAASALRPQSVDRASLTMLAASGAIALLAGTFFLSSV